MDLEFLVPIAFFLSVVWIVKIVSDNRVRQRLVEKGQVDEKVRFLYESNPRLSHLSNVKWGLLLVAIGLGLFVDMVAPGISDASKFGVVFVLAGVAFLIYYVIAKHYLYESEGEKR